MTSPGASTLFNVAPLTPPTVCLIKSANVIEPEDFRWTGGIEFIPEGCGGGGLSDACNTASRTLVRPDAIDRYQPYSAWSVDSCTANGSWSVRDFQARATRKLFAIESKLVENELATGAVCGNPAFQDNTASVLSSSPVASQIALAMLDEAAADCSNGQAMIHVRPYMLTKWQELQVLRRVGDNWLTPMDNIIVPGRGYTGAGPDGTAASTTNTWAYVTGMVTVVRGQASVTPDTLHEALDRASNDVTFYAERPLVAFYDHTCCVYALNCSKTS